MALPNAKEDAEIKAKGATKTAKEKRIEIVQHILNSAVHSDADIARAVGCSRMTVGRIRKEFEQHGATKAAIDKRVNNKRPTTYDEIWKLIEEHKADNGGKGARDIYKWLLIEKGFQEDQIPQLGTIDARLSAKKLVPPSGQKLGQQGQFWLTTKWEEHGDVRGMDEVFPFVTTNGIKIKIVDIRDNYSGAVYGAPYGMARDARDGRGIDGLEFARIFMTSNEHLGTPKELVLDNGGGQILQGSWLPELARHAIECGTRVTWEPYGCPTGNANVERWHRELRKCWRNYLSKNKVMTYDEGCRVLRQIFRHETFYAPRHNLPGRRSPGKVYTLKSWEDGDGTSQIKQYDPIGHQGCTKEGYLSMHRRVEAFGVVQLHGAHILKLSDGLTGSKVRVDFVVSKNGGGIGSVITGKGEIVASFNHRIETELKHGQSLIYDLDMYGYAGSERVNNKVWDQAAYDAAMVTAHKNQRSAGFLRGRDAYGQITDDLDKIVEYE